MIEDFDFKTVLAGIQADGLEISENYVAEIKDRTKYNAELAAYFIRMYEHTNQDRYFRRSYAVGGCGQTMLFDFHNKTRLADLIRLELCHDRFCLNCAKMRQVTYLDRFMPHILAMSDEKEILHLVLTAPNVSAPYLRPYMTIFFQAYGKLIRILNGTVTIRGIDFAPLGFAAALRNTEITYLRKDYHLHIHSIVAVNKGLHMPKIRTNKFSYDYVADPITGRVRRVHTRYFSDFEIFLQRLWRLLVDRIAARVFKFGLLFTEALPPSSPLYHVFKDGVARKVSAGKRKGAVTLDNIRAVGRNNGYSVVLDPVANENFIQVFKYAFKCEDEQAAFMSYDNFVALQEGTHGKKFMQGYGQWLKLKCDENIQDGFDDFFDVFKAYLWQVDRPESVNLTLEETLTKMREGEYTFITRSKLRNLLSNSTKQALLSHKDDFPPAPVPRFSFADLGLAYDRYLRNKDRVQLFGSVQKIVDPESGHNVVLLSEQQLHFLEDLFQSTENCHA